MITVLEAAQRAKEAIRGQAVEGLDEAQHKLEAQLGLSLEAFDEAARPLLEQAEAVRRRGARKPAAEASGRGTRHVASASDRRPPSGSLTPISNRGVRSDPKTTKKSTRTRG